VIDGKLEDTVSFECTIDEVFYVMIKRQIDEDNDLEKRCHWMMLDAKNLALQGNGPENKLM
jgi:hypothetical protein